MYFAEVQTTFLLLLVFTKPVLTTLYIENGLSHNDVSHWFVKSHF